MEQKLCPFVKKREAQSRLRTLWITRLNIFLLSFSLFVYYLPALSFFHNYSLESPLIIRLSLSFESWIKDLDNESLPKLIQFTLMTGYVTRNAIYLEARGFFFSSHKDIKIDLFVGAFSPAINMSQALPVIPRVCVYRQGGAFFSP